MTDKPNPLSVPKRPAWRYEAVSIAGRQIRPATFNEQDRARIDERVLSSSHDDKAFNDQHDTD